MKSFTIIILSAVLLAGMCLSAGCTSSTSAPPPPPAAAPEGLVAEEKSALAAELALEAEEAIDEDNAEAALAELKAEIDADR